MALAHARDTTPEKTYLAQIASKNKTGLATEHTFRPALGDLIERQRTGLNAINEGKRVACGAPDFIVLDGGVPLGYVEAKL